MVILAGGSIKRNGLTSCSKGRMRFIPKDLKGMNRFKSKKKRNAGFSSFTIRGIGSSCFPTLCPIHTIPEDPLVRTFLIL
jgi:hypothetical protein